MDLNRDNQGKCFPKLYCYDTVDSLPHETNYGKDEFPPQPEHRIAEALPKALEDLWNEDVGSCDVEYPGSPTQDELECAFTTIEIVDVVLEDLKNSIQAKRQHEFESIDSLPFPLSEIRSRTYDEFSQEVSNESPEFYPPTYISPMIKELQLASAESNIQYQQCDYPTIGREIFKARNSIFFIADGLEKQKDGTYQWNKESFEIRRKAGATDNTPYKILPVYRIGDEEYAKIRHKEVGDKIYVKRGYAKGAKLELGNSYQDVLDALSQSDQAIISLLPKTEALTSDAIYTNLKSNFTDLSRINDGEPLAGAQRRGAQPLSNLIASCDAYTAKSDSVPETIIVHISTPNTTTSSTIEQYFKLTPSEDKSSYALEEINSLLTLSNFSDDWPADPSLYAGKHQFTVEEGFSLLQALTKKIENMIPEDQKANAQVELWVSDYATEYDIKKKGKNFEAFKGTVAEGNVKYKTKDAIYVKTAGALQRADRPLAKVPLSRLPEHDRDLKIGSQIKVKLLPEPTSISRKSLEEKGSKSLDKQDAGGRKLSL